MHTFQIHYPSEISLLSIYPTALMVHNTTAPTTYTACGLSLQMGLPYHNQYPLYPFMPLNFWLVDLAAEEMDMNDEHLQVPLVPTHSSHVQCCKLNTSSTTQWHSSTYRLRLWRNKHLRFKSYNKVSKQNCMILYVCHSCKGACTVFHWLLLGTVIATTTATMIATMTSSTRTTPTMMHTMAKVSCGGEVRGTVREKH